ncbi:hypothetical protein V6Z11_D13G169800 [Gossypium hirsutum]
MRLLVVKTRLYMLMILLVMCLVLRVSLDLLDQVSYPKKVRVASQGVSNLMKAMKSKKK